jgi:hypothetical protein
MKSDKMKSHYDLQATGEELEEGEAVCYTTPNERKASVQS